MTNKDQRLNTFIDNFMRTAAQYLGCCETCPEMRKYAEREARQCFPCLFAKGGAA